MHTKTVNLQHTKRTMPRRVRRVGSFLALTLFAAAAMFSQGCATKTQNGALLGAGLGAGAGAIIGHQSGHAGEGALIGGATGALAGGLIGNSME